MNTPYDIVTYVMATFGEQGKVMSHTEHDIDIDYSDGLYGQVRIMIDIDGWDIYTTRHGVLWGGSLQEHPPQDIIVKVQELLASWR